MGAVEGGDVVDGGAVVDGGMGDDKGADVVDGGAVVVGDAVVVVSNWQGKEKEESKLRCAKEVAGLASSGAPLIGLEGLISNAATLLVLQQQHRMRHRGQEGKVAGAGEDVGEDCVISSVVPASAADSRSKEWMAESKVMEVGENEAMATLARCGNAPDDAGIIRGVAGAMEKVVRGVGPGMRVLMGEVQALERALKESDSRWHRVHQQGVRAGKLAASYNKACTSMLGRLQMEVGVHLSPALKECMEMLRAGAVSMHQSNAKLSNFIGRNNTALRRGQPVEGSVGGDVSKGMKELVTTLSMAVDEVGKAGKGEW
jgi:hypothetical protein